LKVLRRVFATPPRTAGDLAAIEGPNLLAEAVRSGLRIPTVFLAQGGERILDGLQFGAETEVLIVPKALLIPILATETPQPVAALVEPPDWIWRDLLEGFDQPTTPLIVVLAGLQDPGNVGTILRSAEAFCATGVVSLPGTVSAWNSKAVRASAGSVFRVPLLSARTDECFEKLHSSGLRILTTMASSSDGADRIELGSPVAILIGNEGNGVPPELAAKADGVISIPCHGPVESLNAAVAASLLLYEASRQRPAGRDGRKYLGARR
jgi:TrmH family RNA methyltransferase